MRPHLAICGLALGLLGCEKVTPTQTGIRGHVLLDILPLHLKAGERICASKDELSEDPPCAMLGLDGSFEIIPLSPDTYRLCFARGSSLVCPSLCPYALEQGEVIDVDLSDFMGRMPGDGGFYGTSRRSFDEPGRLDVAHPLRVCVGSPDTPTRTPHAELKCVETDACGRFVLGVPEGSYRVLFAEIGDETTSDRQPCLYHVSAYSGFSIDRVIGQAARDHSVECPEESTPDPL